MGTRFTLLGLVGLAAATLPGSAGSGGPPRPGPEPEGLRPPPEVRVGRAAFGRSGALRVVQADPGEPVPIPLEWAGGRPEDAWYRWVPVEGTRGGTASRSLAGRLEAPAEPGIYELEVGVGAGSVRLDAPRLVVRVPFYRKRGTHLQGYQIGLYPGERGSPPRGYPLPEGFIEVTPANRDLRLSEHFRLGEFLTKDQVSRWPKYVVLELRLIDKLELVLADLNAHGVRAERMAVMSGYRTPQYNRQGLGRGRAALSRHQYGDAADVWVDNDADGYMDDLNGDGRRDTRDARVILAAVERVEARHPELVGGAGIYPDNGIHGPFIHIDVRGRRARW